MMKKDYLMASGFAVLLHCCLLALLLIDNSTTVPTAMPKAVEQVEMIQAVSVDQAQVDQEMDRIQEEQAALEAAKAKRERQHQMKVEKAQAAFRKEQARLKKIKENIKAEQEKQRKEAQKAKLAAKERAAEQKKLAELKKKKALEAKKRKEAAKRKQLALKKAQLAKQKAEAARRAQLAKTQQAAAVDTAKLNRELSRYKTMIVKSIGRNWIVPDSANKSLSCKLQIQLAPGGSVLSVRIIRSSGDAILDRSARSAVYKASPLPVPGEKAVFDKFRLFNLTVRPETVLSSG